MRWYLTGWEDVHYPNFYCARVTEREKQISLTVKLRGTMVISWVRACVPNVPELQASVTSYTNPS